MALHEIISAGVEGQVDKAGVRNVDGDALQQREKFFLPCGKACKGDLYAFSGLAFWQGCRREIEIFQPGAFGKVGLQNGQLLQKAHEKVGFDFKGRRPEA